MIYLEYERRKKGLTQKELAKLINAGKESISLWENQKAIPMPYKQRALAQVLDWQHSPFLLFSEVEKKPFTEAQEVRIREIIKEELPKFEIDRESGAMIVENRLQQLKDKECKDILNNVSARYTNCDNHSER